MEQAKKEGNSSHDVIEGSIGVWHVDFFWIRSI
jgi:hypothetical protein